MVIALKIAEKRKKIRRVHHHQLTYNRPARLFSPILFLGSWLETPFQTQRYSSLSLCQINGKTCILPQGEQKKQLRLKSILNVAPKFMNVHKFL